MSPSCLIVPYSLCMRTLVQITQNVMHSVRQCRSIAKNANPFSVIQEKVLENFGARASGSVIQRSASCISSQEETLKAECETCTALQQTTVLILIFSLRRHVIDVLAYGGVSMSV